MRTLNRLPAAALALLAGLFVVSVAYAQDTVVEARPFVELLLPFVTAVTVALIGALVPLIFVYILKRWGIDVEKESRDAFQTSVTNAAGLLLQKAGSAAAAGKLDVRSPILAEAIRYVQNAAPDAIAKWGITPEKIATTVIAKLPQIEASSGAAPLSTPAIR